jgi:hypothetical protein
MPGPTLIRAVPLGGFRKGMQTAVGLDRQDREVRGIVVHRIAVDVVNMSVVWQLAIQRPADLDVKVVAVAGLPVAIHDPILHTLKRQVHVPQCI